MSETDDILGWWDVKQLQRVYRWLPTLTCHASVGNVRSGDDRLPALREPAPSLGQPNQSHRLSPVSTGQESAPLSYQSQYVSTWKLYDQHTCYRPTSISSPLHTHPRYAANDRQITVSLVISLGALAPSHPPAQLVPLGTPPPPHDRAARQP